MKRERKTKNKRTWEEYTHKDTKTKGKGANKIKSQNNPGAAFIQRRKKKTKHRCSIMT